jgi:hypothetical protein
MPFERLSVGSLGNPYSDRYLAIKREQLGPPSDPDPVAVSDPLRTHVTHNR